MLKFTYDGIPGCFHISRHAIHVSFGPMCFHLDDIMGPLRDYLDANYRARALAIQESKRR